MADIPTERPNEINPVIESSGEPQVSSADTPGEPQGYQHITMSSSSVVESSGEPLVSSADTMSGPQGDQHTTMSALLAILLSRYPALARELDRRQHYNRAQVEVAQVEVAALRDQVDMG